MRFKIGLGRWILLKTPKIYKMVKGGWGRPWSKSGMVLLGEDRPKQPKIGKIQPKIIEMVDTPKWPKFASWGKWTYVKYLRKLRDEIWAKFIKNRRSFIGTHLFLGKTLFLSYLSQKSVKIAEIEAPSPFWSVFAARKISGSLALSETPLFAKTWFLAFLNKLSIFFKSRLDHEKSGF